MINHLVNLIFEAIKKNGPISVFWGGVIEQVITPIPSPLIPMSAGFLLLPKHLSLLSAWLEAFKKISLPYSLGATLGASLLYFIAFFGGRKLIEKYGKFFALSLNNIDKFKSRFTRGFKDEILIFFLIILPVTPISIVTASCGLIGISFWEFFPLLLIGIFLRSSLLALLGWKIGETYTSIAHSLDKTESLLTIVCLVAIFILLGYLYFRREKFFKSA